ncbi:ATP-binding protein [Alteromonas gilva]|uniref:histidine kinase n=1 Tax=Alteromonas gilva TaxID=2987522 RepID=A0ABT5L4R9_9ALTE|nr:ATP-binding protein [Alteromonas gilva]MDC8832040.1 ATP-binding protein [Alteromonas gilva]
MKGEHVYLGAENGFFDIVGESATIYNQDNSVLGDGYISNLAVDSKGYIWLTQYGSGTYRYSPYSKEFSKLELPDEFAQFSWAIKISQGKAAISLIDSLLVYDLINHNWEVVNKDSTGVPLKRIYSVDSFRDGAFVFTSQNNVAILDSVSLETKFYNRQDYFPGLSQITAIEAHENKLLIGGRGGLYIWDMKTEPVFFPMSDERSKESDVERIFTDSSGRIWVAAVGLYYVNTISKTLKAIKVGQPKYSYEQIKSVGDVKETTDGQIIVASSQLGILNISPSDEAINYIHQTEFPYRKDIYSVTSLGQNHYLAKTAGSWLELNADTGKLTVLKGNHFDSEPIPLPENRVFSPQTCSVYSLDITGLVRQSAVADADNFCPYIRPLHYTKDDAQFLFYQAPTHAGLVRYAANTISHFANAPKNVRFMASREGMPVVIMDSSNVMYTMEGHGVWIKHDTQAMKSVYVYCMYADPDERAVYFCTSGKGIKRYSLQSKKLSDAFANNNTVPRFIRDGYLDSAGNHWLATNKGLVLVKGDFVFAFEQSDGIVDTDFNYQGILPMGPDQFLLAGDQLSYVVNTPKLAAYVERRRQHTAYASILNVRSRSDSEASIPVSNKGEQYLFADQPDEVTFEFASADFIYPHLQHLEYRLAGFNQAWQALPANIGTVAYSGLGVGEFDFQVRVIDSKSVNTQPISHYRFAIPTPLWQSRQAYFAYLCLLGVAIWLAIKGYRWHLSEKGRMLEQIIENKQSALLDSNRSITELLAKKERIFSNLAKEIRTPVMRILIPLTELRQQNQTTSARRSLDLIYENAGRLKALVEQLNVVQRIDHISKQLKQTYDVDKTLRYIIETHRPAAHKKHLSITFDNQIKEPVLAVQDSLETMISNLLVNAIRFTQEGGHIKVKAKQLGEQVTFSVIDNGAGMSAKDVDLLVSRFARGTNYTGKPEMGIGLNLVNQLALANDGWIEIHSEPEVGTTVCIHLPCYAKAPVTHLQGSQDKRASSLMVAEQRASYSNLDLPVILIVDNSQDACDYLTDILREKYNCYSIQQGWKALELIPVILPELVISELNIQDMSGAELTQKIRALEDFADLPVMILTAQSEHSAKITSFKATVSDYLIKPVEREELISRIESNLAISRLSHQSQRRHEQDEQAAENLTYVQSILPQCKTDKERKFIVNLLDVVERNYAQETFNRSQAASELAMSERTLNRTMADLLPDNFALFLKKYRLEKSLPLLAAGHSITSIALEVGFGSAAYYSRCFKQEYGYLPKDVDPVSGVSGMPDR